MVQTTHVVSAPTTPPLRPPLGLEYTPRKTTYRENENFFSHTTDTGTSIDKEEPNSNSVNTTTADTDHVNYDMEPSQELLENNDECIAPRY